MATSTNSIASIWDIYTSAVQYEDWNDIKTAISEVYGTFNTGSTGSSHNNNEWGPGLCPKKSSWLKINDYAEGGEIKIKGTYEDNQLIKFSDLAYNVRNASISVNPTSVDNFSVFGGDLNINITYNNANDYYVNTPDRITYTKGVSSTTLHIPQNDSYYTESDFIYFTCSSKKGNSATATVYIKQLGASNINVIQNNKSYPPGATSDIITVYYYNMELPSYSSDQTWCTVTKGSTGPNKMDFNYSITTNTGNSRTATITFEGTGKTDNVKRTETRIISQSSGISELSASVNSVNFTPNSGTSRFNISSQNIDFNITSNKTWCTVSKVYSNLYEISVDVNNLASRLATITIEGTGKYDNVKRTVNIIVSQESGESSISLSGNPVILNVDQSSTSKTYTVIAENIDNYTVVSNQTWCTVSKTSNALTINISANGYDARTATVTVEGTGKYDNIKRTVEITINQSSGASSLSVNPSNKIFPVMSSTDWFDVTKTNISSYTVSSDQSWCTVSRSGNRITVSVSNNTGPIRYAKITVTGTNSYDYNVKSTFTISITQESGESSISLNQHVVVLKNDNYSNTATIDINFENVNSSTISVTANDSWCNSSISSNNTKLTISATKNNNITRNAELTISCTGKYDNTTRTAKITVYQIREEGKTDTPRAIFDPKSLEFDSVSSTKYVKMWLLYVADYDVIINDNTWINCTYEHNNYVNVQELQEVILAVTVSDNASSKSRTGTITITYGIPESYLLNVSQLGNNGGFFETGAFLSGSRVTGTFTS